MRENLSLESPRSRDNFLRQPQIGAYFTKKASILQHRMKFHPYPTFSGMNYPTFSKTPMKQP